MYATRDERTGGVILSNRPGARNWGEFFELMDTIDVPEDYMAERLVRVLAWDSDAADYYAEIRHQLVASGKPIGELDMMIAAHSLSAGAVLVTNNTRHYARIVAPLTVVDWAAAT